MQQNARACANTRDVHHPGCKETAQAGMRQSMASAHMGTAHSGAAAPHLRGAPCVGLPALIALDSVGCSPPSPRALQQQTAGTVCQACLHA